MEDAEGARRRYREIRAKVAMKSILLLRGTVEANDLIEGPGDNFRKAEEEEVESLDRVRRTEEARLYRGLPYSVRDLILERIERTYPDHPCLSKLLRHVLNAIFNLAKSCSQSPSTL